MALLFPLLSARLVITFGTHILEAGELTDEPLRRGAVLMPVENYRDQDPMAVVFKMHLE